MDYAWQKELGRQISVLESQARERGDIVECGVAEAARGAWERGLSSLEVVLAAWAARAAGQGKLLPDLAKQVLKRPEFDYGTQKIVHGALETLRRHPTGPWPLDYIGNLD